jgi:hypothetical protein
MFGINKKLRNQALIYGGTKGEIYVSRGENVLYLTTYTRQSILSALLILSALDHITMQFCAI